MKKEYLAFTLSDKSHKVYNVSRSARKADVILHLFSNHRATQILRDTVS